MMPAIPAYATWMLAGLTASLFFWLRLSKSKPATTGLYLAALAGAFLGAKLVYMLSEGFWFHGPSPWKEWATGKSILGALLGGFLMVEAIKKLADIKTTTGDWFASFVPLAVAGGRLGCISQGCCRGLPITLNAHTTILWPAPHVELLFNLTAAITFYIFRRRQLLTGQHFHLYMMAYGLFRFLHEPLRNTAKFEGLFSGYQFFALALFAAGYFGYANRRKQPTLSNVLLSAY